MNSRIIFCLFLSVQAYCLNSSYVMVGSREPLEADHEVALPSPYRSRDPISLGCFGQTGSTLALVAGKTVMLYVMGHSKEADGSFVRVPGGFLKRFHFGAPVTSVSLDESANALYVAVNASTVSRIDWKTDQQKSLEVSHLPPPLKLSSFQENLVSISNDTFSIIYNASTEKIVMRKESRLAGKDMQSLFAWRIGVDDKGKAVIKSRVDYVAKDLLCANCPDVMYPVVKTGIDSSGRQQLVLVDKKKKESYRPLFGNAISLTRSPTDSNLVIVGYEDGDMEMINLSVFVARWKYKNIHCPFVFNSYGTQLVGVRGQKFVMISTSKSEEESDLIKKSLVLSGINMLTGKAAMQSMLSAFQKQRISSLEKKSKKKKKSGNRKKKKNKSKNAR